MDKEKYNQIIDDVYKVYVKYWEPNIEYIDGKAILTQEEFINKIKKDKEFSEKWGLKIEEKELSHDERYKIMQLNISTATLGKPTMYNHEYYNSKNIPTKKITLEYNNEKTYFYE